MELFFPSILILLLAGAVVFFIFPRFGPFSLAILSIALLTLGVYQHASVFGTEYRLSTWQLGVVAYAPYVLLIALLGFISMYIFYLMPASSASSTADLLPLPSISSMPPPESATNVVTGAINRAVNAVATPLGFGANANANKNNGIMNALGLGGNNKKNNNGLKFPFSQI